MRLRQVRELGYTLSLTNDNEDLLLQPATAPSELVDKIRKHKKALLSELASKRDVELISPKPGDELAKLLPKTRRASCGCMKFQQKMNAWGVSGCIDNEAEIIKHLEIQSESFLPFAGMLKPAVRMASKYLLGKAISACRMTAVWVYWHGGADGDELRYSMRSVKKNVSDLSNIVLCGDKPPWYRGEFIDSPRYGRAHAAVEFGSGRFAKWVDSIIKLQAIIESDLVTENFLWMYDDTFIVKNTSIAELAIPRAGGILYAEDLNVPSRRKWREVRRRTQIALHEQGLPVRDYSTHMPVVFNKSKLSETFSMFNPRINPRCIESLYMNHHYEHPETVGRILQYRKKIRDSFHVNEFSTVLNVGGFSERVASVITPMFSEAMELESDG